MASVPVQVLSFFLLLACAAFGADAPRIAIVETDDQYTHVLGLSEFLKSEGHAITDFSDTFERGQTPDLSKVDLLIIGSFVTSDPQKKVTYRSMAAGMRQFVSEGGTIAILAQPPAESPYENWMQEPRRVVRGGADAAKLFIHQATHPLLTQAANIAAADLTGWKVPVGADSANTAWDSVTSWTDAGVILKTNEDSVPKAGALLECEWGKGRAIFYSMAPDKAYVCGNDRARRAAASLLRNLVAYAASVRAGSASGVETTPAPGFQHRIRGTVFADLNGDGQRGANEPGREGIGVSDGFTVVLTNASGEFDLPNEAGDARFVFIHQPGDVKQNGDAFFRRLSDDAGSDTRVNFGLQPLPAGLATENTIRFVQLTDSHVRSVSDRNYMQQATSEIYAMNPPPDFVVATGDLVDWGVDEHFQNYVAGMQKPPVPYFNVFGNHELIRGPIDRYHHYIGPDYYSFERNGILFLALNCVTPTKRQNQWLEQTLKVLGKGRPVVVFQHYPPALDEMERFSGLGVKSVFSGHWHCEKEIEHDSVQSINSPTFIMGGIDASPAGFKIVRLGRDGTADTEWRYGFQKHRLSIVSPQQGSPVATTSFPVVVNAYDTSTEVKSVNWRLGDEKNPAANGELARESASAWVGESKSSSLAPGSYPFRVEVKDEAGATWTADQQIETIAGTPAVPAPAGDWPMFMGNPARTGYSSGSIETPLRLAWSVDSGGDPDFASPILAEGRLYLGLKKRTRNRIHGVAAFDPVTGKRLWLYQTPNAINHTPAYANGTLCVAEMGGRVYGIGAKTGERLWLHDLLDPRGRYSYCAPIALEGSFYAGVMRAFVQMRPSDGRAAWQQKIGDTDTDWISSYGSPAAAGDYLAMSGRTKGDAVVVASRKDGKKVWGHPAEGGMLGSVTIAGERVLFCGTKSTLFCRRLQDGTALWQTPLGAEGGDGKWSATTPAVKMTAEGTGIVVAGSGDGRMSGVDLSEGKVLWTHTSDSTIYKVSPYRRDDRPLLSSPTIAGDKVFFGSADGHLYALDLATGRKLWSYTIGVPVMSTPAVSGNALYVAAYDGRIYAFTAAGRNGTK
jgi:outer membrane protein assembly factor BamB